MWWFRCDFQAKKHILGLLRASLGPYISKSSTGMSIFQIWYSIYIIWRISMLKHKFAPRQMCPQWPYLLKMTYFPWFAPKSPFDYNGKHVCVCQIQTVRDFSKIFSLVSSGNPHLMIFKQFSFPNCHTKYLSMCPFALLIVFTME